MFFFFNVELVLCVVFFFQAEDGIRDGRVTGVQTCALPISFHDGNVSPDAAVCARAGIERSDPDNAGRTARAESSARRLTPEMERLGDMIGSFFSSILPSGRAAIRSQALLVRQLQGLEFLASRTKAAK